MMMRAIMLALIAVIGGLLGAVAVLHAQATHPGDTIQLWEYHTEIVRGPSSPAVAERAEARRTPAVSPDAMLNSWGRNGWELVGVTRREVRVDDVMESETLFAFKRPTRPVNR